MTPAMRSARPRLRWDKIAAVTIFHLGALAAPWTFTWSALWVFIGLFMITKMIGVSIGYHRLLTHRSFRVPKWLEYTIAVCGCLGQGRPISWVAQHRVHHAFADRIRDPHSPRRGFWWAHIRWFLVSNDLTDDPCNFSRIAPDLGRDPFYRWLERYAFVPSGLLALGLFAWGGLPFLVWGLFLRQVAVFHVTWLVNSAATTWGYQSYETGEDSRNNWWVALLDGGDGWHNNHHAFPYSAAHGLRWWEVDLDYQMIRLLGWLGVATDIRLPEGRPHKLPPAQQLPPRRAPKSLT